jgi:hypothetical protein
VRRGRPQAAQLPRRRGACDHPSIKHHCIYDALLADRRLLCFSRFPQPTSDYRAEWEVPLHRTPQMSWLGRRVFGLEPWDN